MLSDFMKTSTGARNEDGGKPRATTFGAGQARANLLAKTAKECTPLSGSENLKMFPIRKPPFGCLTHRGQ